MTPIPPDMTPTKAELLTEARRLVYVTAGLPSVNVTVTWGPAGPVITRDQAESRFPAVGSAEWWAAPDQLKASALVVLAESYLVADPDRQVRQRMRQVSHGISEGMDWAAAAHRLAYAPHSVLAARRAEPGPLARVVDPAAMARWVQTGRSDGGEVPAA